MVNSGGGRIQIINEKYLDKFQALIQSKDPNGAAQAKSVGGGVLNIFETRSNLF